MGLRRRPAAGLVQHRAVEVEHVETRAPEVDERAVEAASGGLPPARLAQVLAEAKTAPGGSGWSRRGEAARGRARADGSSRVGRVRWR
jgi:hypothetical protein